ncbi:MAG: endoglucanase [Flavobacteriales bacterium]|jgi:endoglucanase
MKQTTGFREKVIASAVAAHPLKLLSFGALALSAQLCVAVEPISVQGVDLLVGDKKQSLHGVVLPPTQQAEAFASEFSDNGNSIYNPFAMRWLEDDWDAGFLGIAVSVEGEFGFKNAPETNLVHVETLVEQAIAGDTYALVRWQGGGEPQNVDSALAFFREVASRWGANANLIYQINYQPQAGVKWDGTIKPYANSVVQAIRQIDTDNLIVVATPELSRDVLTVANDPLHGVSNVVYALNYHVGKWGLVDSDPYSDSVKGPELRENANQARDLGLPLFVADYQVGFTDSSTGEKVEESLAQWRFWLAKNHMSSAVGLVHEDLNPAKNRVYANLTARNVAGNAHSLVNWGRNDVNSDLRTHVTRLNGRSCLFANAEVIQAENYCHKEGLSLFNTRDFGGGKEIGTNALELLINDTRISTRQLFEIDVPVAADYKISYRVARTNGSDSEAELEARNTFRPGDWEGFPLGEVTIPTTANFDNWETVEHTIPLPAGRQWLNIRSSNDVTWGLNWFKFDFAGFNAEANGNLTLQAEHFVSQQGVQTEQSTDIGGGENVGYIDRGDWMKYAVSLPASASGEYEISYRVSSPSDDAYLQLEAYGGDEVYDSIKIPNTGGWQDWQVIKQRVTLPQGLREFVVVATGDDWNINWINIAAKSECLSSECYQGGHENVRVEAEDFSNMQGVIVDNGVVGWVDDGDWLVYNRELPLLSETNRYKITYRVARGMDGDGIIQLEAPGGSIAYNRIKVPNTGGWDSYVTLSHTVDLPRDIDGLALAAVKGGWNLDWFEIETLE